MDRMTQGGGLLRKGCRFVVMNDVFHQRTFGGG